MNKKRMVLFIVLTVFASLAMAASPPVRVKDVAHILEARENQLAGFGLVAGLNRTGDSYQSAFTQQALTNVLSKMGVAPQALDFKSRNVAAVMVTATLPPFLKPGQKIDVVVSSVGDATTLKGGTLLLTPLFGSDDQVYAVAQGPVTFGFAGGEPDLVPLKYPETTVGNISGGGLIEREVPVSIGKGNQLTIVLNNPDFTTASRMSDSIRAAGYDSYAQDAATVVVPFTENEDYIDLASRVERLTFVPDTVARVVINEKTGTIVIGENVRIAPVAVSYGRITVTVGDIQVFSEATPVAAGYDQGSLLSTQSRAQVSRRSTGLNVMPASATLAEVARAMNAIKASPQDMISILQSMKRVGALAAEIEII